MLVLQSIADILLGLLFPDRCASCGQTGSLFCAACRTRLRPYPPGSPTMVATHACATLLDAAAVVYVFESPLRDVVHCLKYKRVRRMALPLAGLLDAHLCQHPLPADAVIPVPLHPRRMAERGFNQSELLARHLARTGGMALVTNGLTRQRNTEHQARLDMRQRQQNMHNAFVWQKREPPPARVLLLDDVLTTGATITACAHALRQAGTTEVRALALARSRPE